jgi:hypothetical protein
MKYKEVDNIFKNRQAIYGYYFLARDRRACSKRGRETIEAKCLTPTLRALVQPGLSVFEG